MKHTPKITILLLLLFLSSELFGLIVLNKYITKRTVKPNGEVVVSWKESPYVERPQINQTTSFLYVLIGIILGTLLLLLLIKLKAVVMWKLWYFLAVLLSMGISLAAFFSTLWATLLALVLSLLKTMKPNVLVHNLTEPLVYAGIAALLVPVFNIPSAIILLLLISIYDYLAVNKIKHMITLAEFQTSQNNFAGLMIPYKNNNLIFATKPSNKISSTAKPNPIKAHKTLKLSEGEGSPHKSSTNYNTAILGGGDIALPMIFIGTVMKEYNMTAALIVTISATLALAYLLYTSEKKKYYPAMPFLTIGCLLGYIISVLVV